MFEKLFRSRALVQRHLNSPLLQARLEYLQYCANQGYSLITLRGLAADLLLIQNLLGLATSSDSLGPAAVQAGVNRWVDRRPRHHKHKNGRRGREQPLPRAVAGFVFWGACKFPARRLRPIVLCSNRTLTTCGWKRGFRKGAFGLGIGMSKTFCVGSFRTTTQPACQRRPLIES